MCSAVLRKEREQHPRLVATLETEPGLTNPAESWAPLQANQTTPQKKTKLTPGLTLWNHRVHRANQLRVNPEEGDSGTSP